MHTWMANAAAEPITLMVSKHHFGGMQGAASAWSAFLATLPAATLTPILWPDEERAQLLRGSPVLEEARAREAALQQEWQELAAAISSAPDSTAAYPASVFHEQAFLEVRQAQPPVLRNPSAPKRLHGSSWPSASLADNPALCCRTQNTPHPAAAAAAGNVGRARPCSIPAHRAVLCAAAAGGRLLSDGQHLGGGDGL